MGRSLIFKLLFSRWRVALAPTICSFWGTPPSLDSQSWCSCRLCVFGGLRSSRNRALKGGLATRGRPHPTLGLGGPAGAGGARLAPGAQGPHHPGSHSPCSLGSPPPAALTRGHADTEGGQAARALLLAGEGGAEVPRSQDNLERSGAQKSRRRTQAAFPGSGEQGGGLTLHLRSGFRTRGVQSFGGRGSFKRESARDRGRLRDRHTEGRRARQRERRSPSPAPLGTVSHPRAASQTGSSARAHRGLPGAAQAREQATWTVLR